MSKLVDIDLCIGCKACEVACKEWNGLEPDDTHNFGSYQSHEDLTATTWDLMRFKEVDLDNGDLAWLIRKDSCLHCDEPGCLLACPAPGAIVQYENGIVDFDQSKCIGCQYCVAGCPFDIPRFDRTTKKVYKCTMCVDRVAGGLEPACVKACPTGSIRFGSRQEMLAYGETKVAKLADRGFDDALLYDPSGVNGLHMMYVVPRGNMLDDYGLPKDPEVRSTFSFIGALQAVRGVGAVAIWAGVIGAGICTGCAPAARRRRPRPWRSPRRSAWAGPTAQRRRPRPRSPPARSPFRPGSAPRRRVRPGVRPERRARPEQTVTGTGAQAEEARPDGERRRARGGRAVTVTETGHGAPVAEPTLRARTRRARSRARRG